LQRQQYVCPKCGCRHYESDEFRATGGALSQMFDIQNKRFITISCAQCGYTELYRSQNSAGMNILDLLMGG